ncbi:MAG TPA: hypothetical protein VIN32_03490 [Candidatus Limnocylindria bacterium]
MATLFGLVGRFTGKLLTMSLGWASLLPFGRVPRDKEIFLAAITFGSVGNASDRGARQTGQARHGLRV